MTQPTLLSLGTPSHVKMPKRQAGEGGEFRSMLDPAARGMPGKGEPGSDEALGRASVRAQISFEAAGPTKSDRIDGDDDDTLDELPAEPEEEAAAAAPAAEATAVGELRFLLGDAGRQERTSTGGAVTEGIQTSRRAEAAPSWAGAHNTGAPAGEGGDGAAVALPGADGAEAEHPAARTRATADAPAERAVERVAAPATPEAGKEAPKAGHDGAVSHEAKSAGVRIAPAAGGKGSAETRRDGAGQHDGKNESKPSLTGVTITTEGAANAQAAPQPTARTVVVATLGADPSWAAYFLAKPAPTQSTPQALTVQLRPAELGVVSAHLSFNGDNLTVELRPETQEAHNQLSRDSDAIARSLRAIGMEVDHVTVQPASTAQDGGRGALNARSDGQGGGQQGPGQAFTSPDSQGERGGGRQQGQGNPPGFGSRSVGDEMRGGAGGGDRDGRYI